MSILPIISDALSVFIISLCLILKIPQIINIVKVQNAEGINVYGLLLELTSYSIMALYNYLNGYALLSYMEYPIIIFQQYVLIFLVMKYKNLIGTLSLGLSGFYFAIITSFAVGIIPSGILNFLVPLCTPVGASGKVIQLIEILRIKQSESVSLLTWFLSAFTNYARLFTIYMDSADTKLLLNFTVTGSLSLSVLLAASYYRRYPSKAAD